MNPGILAGGAALFAYLWNKAAPKQVKAAPVQLPMQINAEQFKALNAIPTVPVAKPATPEAGQNVVSNALQQQSWQQGDGKSSTVNPLEIVKKTTEILMKVKDIFAGGVAAIAGVIAIVYTIISSISDAMEAGRVIGYCLGCRASAPLYWLHYYERKLFHALNDNGLLTRLDPATNDYKIVQYRTTDILNTTDRLADNWIPNCDFADTGMRSLVIERPAIVLAGEVGSNRQIPRDEKIAVARYIRHYAYAMTEAMNGWALGISLAINDRFLPIVPAINRIQDYYRNSARVTIRDEDKYTGSWWVKDNAWLAPSYIEELTLSPDSPDEKRDNVMFRPMVQVAREIALRTVLSCLKKDAKVYFPWTPDWYTERILKGMNTAEGLGFSGATVMKTWDDKYWIRIPDSDFLGPYGYRYNIIAFKEGRPDLGVSTRMSRQKTYDDFVKVVDAMAPSQRVLFAAQLNILKADIN